MDKEQEKLETIYIGYHPRSNDGSSPLTRSLDDSIAIMDDYNKSKGEDNFRAEVVKIACSDLCAVVVMETEIGKVWQYL
ncbi:MAG: hypothetical protein ACNI3A_12630 [Desulfovibrio sp.]|uniref:hypothetical protein n=1 Tax=Desulfovibrio sp. 7SRBS1 TaxID=3378064 RepID=UPI003B40EC2E